MSGRTRRVVLERPFETEGSAVPGAEPRASLPPPRDAARPRSVQDEIWLPLDPLRPRQLAHVVALWRGPESRRECLAIGVRPAPAPAEDDGCGERAILDVLRIDDRSVALCDGPGGLDAFTMRPWQGMARPVRSAFTVLVDLETGEIERDPSREPDPDGAAWLARELDGELLDHVHRTVVAPRGLDPDRRASVESLRGWSPGHLLRYSAVYPDSRREAFRFGGRTYRVGESHCPIALCPCHALVLDVVDMDGAPLPEYVGAVRLAPPSASVEITAERERSDDLLLEILDRFRDRYPGLGRLVERRRRVAVMGSLLVERYSGGALLARAPRQRK